MDYSDLAEQAMAMGCVGGQDRMLGANDDARATMTRSDLVVADLRYSVRVLCCFGRGATYIYSLLMMQV